MFPCPINFAVVKQIIADFPADSSRFSVASRQDRTRYKKRFSLAFPRRNAIRDVMHFRPTT
jgi:hypothetical protein